MTEEISTVLIFAVAIVLILLVGYIGNKIVDKGEDAIRNARKRRKNLNEQGKKEKLADRF